MTDWETVVAAHRELVWRTAYRLLGDHQDAADCFQETFLSALRVARRQHVRCWPALLSCLATSRAMDRLRQRMRYPAQGNDSADWATVPSLNAGPVQQAEAVEMAARLRRALTHLPSQQAEVFCLRYVNELSYREIARELNLKTSAVGVLLHRARSRLREMLDPAAARHGPQVLP